MNLEDNLRAALRREHPPEGFADRVLQRLPAATPARSRFRMSWLAAAAALILFFSGIIGWQQRQARQKAQAEQARQELLFALELTAAELQNARIKLVRHTRGII